MKYTSAEAAKLIKSLNEQRSALATEIIKKSTFPAAMGEDPETVRPEFNLTEALRTLDKLEERIRRVKHELNIFNATTVIPDIEMTIDQVLLYIPQLSYRKEILAEMAGRLSKERDMSPYLSSSPIVNYIYANYDIEDAKKELKEVSEKLTQVQLALDRVNSTVSFEIPD